MNFLFSFIYIYICVYHFSSKSIGAIAANVKENSTKIFSITEHEHTHMHVCTCSHAQFCVFGN
jgi:hypothetical protein